MIKRVLAIFSLLVLLPLSGFAISISEIQNNPSRYIKTSDENDMAMYVDINSIKSLRVVFPYYTAQAKVYSIFYNGPSIGETTYTINYDYNRSAAFLNAVLLKNYPNMTQEQRSRILFDEVIRDCGISLHYSSMPVYALNGTYLKQINVPAPKTYFNSPNYKTANFIFKQCYKDYFSLYS